MNALPFSVYRSPAGYLLGAVLALVPTGLLHAQEVKLPEHGLWVTVPNPITDASRTNIENAIDRAKNVPGRKLAKVVFDFNPGDAEAATSNYGSCLDLARFIRKLSNNGILTIAFVHAKTTRHTVLPVLACDNLVMSADAKIGDVAGNERVPEADAREYAALAGHAREAVVSKMIYKDVEIVIGFEAGNPIYVDPKKVGKPPFEGVAMPKQGNLKVVKAAGDIGLYDINDALTFKLCSKSVASRQELADGYNITFDSESGAGPVKAVKIELAGLIDEAFKQKLFGQLRDLRSKNENMAFILLQCSGGSAKVAREIADELRELKNDKKESVRTIAFIPASASDLATFIAFGCSEIVMFKGSDKDSEATIGDFDQFLATASKSSDSSNTVDFIRRNLAQVAEARGYDRILVDGFVDRDLQIYRARNQKTGVDEIITGQQFEADKRGEKKYGQGQSLKQPGSCLKLNATRARELRIAQGTVDNRDIKEVYSMYGVSEKDVRDAKPSWVDDFAAFLRRTEIIIFVLLPLAFAGMLLEIKMPGAIAPGLVSLICFGLFFWSWAYANGATIYLAMALFVLGLLLLAVEIFVLPGFGVMGVSGVLLVLAGIGLATLEKAPSSSEEWAIFGGRLVQYGLSLIGAGVVAAVFARFLPKIPYANRLMLVPPTDKPDIDGEALLPGAEQAAALLGQVGTATSMLRPAGMARFADQFVDVVTEGDFIEPGTAIQVVEVEGTRIVVKRV